MDSWIDHYIDSSIIYIYYDYVYIYVCMYVL